MTTPDDVLTPAEAGEAIKVDPRRVRAWIRAGELPAIDVSLPNARRRAYRIRRGEWEAFIQRREVAPTPHPRRVAGGRRRSSFMPE